MFSGLFCVCSTKTPMNLSKWGIYFVFFSRRIAVILSYCPVLKFYEWQYRLCLTGFFIVFFPQSRAQLWLTNLDNFIQQRHLERCFRLFLKCSIQRQARGMYCFPFYLVRVNLLNCLYLMVLLAWTSIPSSIRSLKFTSTLYWQVLNNTKHYIVNCIYYSREII